MTGVFSSLRHVVRIIAIVLLAWTAFDLANPQCCLREVIPVATSTSLSAAGHSVPPPAPDDDDCFCCARCIDTGMRIPSFDQPFAWIDFAERAVHLTTRAAALDHPPQNA